MTERGDDRPARVRECHEALFDEGLTRRTVAAFYDVYNALGYGFGERVYTQALQRSLRDCGLAVARQESEARFRGRVVGRFQTALLVESRIVVHLTSSRRLDPEHSQRLLNCLRATGLEIGLLFHFGPRAGYRRCVLRDGARNQRARRREATLATVLPVGRAESVRALVTL